MTPEQMLALQPEESIHHVGVKGNQHIWKVMAVVNNGNARGPYAQLQNGSAIKLARARDLATFAAAQDCPDCAEHLSAFGAKEQRGRKKREQSDRSERPSVKQLFLVLHRLQTAERVYPELKAEIIPMLKDYFRMRVNEPGFNLEEVLKDG